MIAVAYAFERVLKVVGEEGSRPALNAVMDLPNVRASVGDLICNDSLGLLGGEADIAEGWYEATANMADGCCKPLNWQDHQRSKSLSKNQR